MTARVQVGDVQILGLSDGAGSPPASRVYPDHPEAAERFADVLDGGNLRLNYGCFVLRADGRTVLVDCGNGPERDGTLMRELDEAGVDPASIDFVAFTHLHGDHTGWNLDRETGKPRFANARYLVPLADWEDGIAADGEGRSFDRDIRPLEKLGVLDLIDGERAITQSIVTLPTPGHTRGHTTYVVSSGGQDAYILGDAFLSPVDIEELEWVTTWDSDGKAVVRTRTMLADRIRRTDALVGASHLPAPGFGNFVLVEGRRTWKALV